MSAHGRVVIIGQGGIGKDLRSRIGAGAMIVGARDFLDMAESGASELLRGASTVVFAHGASVNTRSFRRDFKTLLQSRMRPVDKAAQHLSNACRYILVSSTVAYRSPSDAGGLAALQNAYESHFRTALRGANTVILRFGTVVTGNGNVEQSLARLSRTFILRRLRVLSRTEIAYVGTCTMQATSTLIASSSTDFDGEIIAVAEPEGLDLNALLDALLPARVTIPVPLRLYTWLFGLFGVRPEFFETSLALVKAKGGPQLSGACKPC
ncbi:hypothetical protein [Rhizobium rhizogenes]|uniref:hypothetical protein n=1 Tax=Rhizobium rhizogenes TaxID=359 RepID=UPI0024BE7774|nr:hypothetical protein [Rhizobium rhizogenes]MDJ1638189.1 hypothetical protein [Rhizobium rhizogenes]